MVDGVIGEFVQIGDVKCFQQRKSIWCSWFGPRWWKMTWGSLQTSHHIVPNIIHKISGIIISLGHSPILWLSIGVVRFEVICLISPKIISAPLTHLRLTRGCPNGLSEIGLRDPAICVVGCRHLTDIWKIHINQWMSSLPCKWRGNSNVLSRYVHVGNGATMHLNLGVGTKQRIPTKRVV